MLTTNQIVIIKPPSIYFLKTLKVLAAEVKFLTKFSRKIPKILTTKMIHFTIFLLKAKALLLISIKRQMFHLTKLFLMKTKIRTQKVKIVENFPVNIKREMGILMRVFLKRIKIHTAHFLLMGLFLLMMETFRT